MPVSYRRGGSWLASRALLPHRVKALPDRFDLVGVAVRRDAEVERLAERGIPAVTELRHLDDLSPDFVVVATPAEANAATCEQLADQGHPILLETPPGVDDNELDHLLALDVNAVSPVPTLSDVWLPWRLLAVLIGPTVPVAPFPQVTAPELQRRGA